MLSDLLKEMGPLKEKIEKMKNDTVELRVTGSSGAGMVNVTLNGNYFIEDLTISDEVMKMNDKNMLEVLITSAFNDAVQKVTNEITKLGAKAIGQMGLPF